MPLSRNPSAIQWTSLETAAYILSSTKISDVASRRCTSGVTQLKTGKFGGSQRMRAESAEGRLTVPVRQRSPYPKFGRRRRRRRHSKNSSRQFQVGLHIITSLQQRCGGPTSETELAAKAQNASSRPQDICFFRNTQKTTFMSARWSRGSFPR